MRTVFITLAFLMLFTVTNVFAGPAAPTVSFGLSGKVFSGADITPCGNLDSNTVVARIGVFEHYIKEYYTREGAERVFNDHRRRFLLKIIRHIVLDFPKPNFKETREILCFVLANRFLDAAA